MKKDNPYGYCPICGSPGRYRERRPNGNDKCHNGHTYPSRSATPTADVQKQETIDYDLKKLLPLAARAMGCEFDFRGPLPLLLVDCHWKFWHPAESPGDGAEMEDKLRISVERFHDGVDAISVFGGPVTLFTERYADHPDVGTARRWASLRVAAEIGRNME